MARKTTQERLSRALIVRGYPEITTNPRTRRIFRRPDGRFYFVGRSGGLRGGSTISSSLSYTGSQLYHQLLSEVPA